MKITKNQAANLKQIWTAKTTAGGTDATRARRYRFSRNQAKSAGYEWMNGNAVASMLDKGLAVALVTKDQVLDARVLVLVLTDAGRAAIGV